MISKYAFTGLDNPHAVAYLARGTLHRAFVACPPFTDHGRYDERVVFFEVPHTQPSAGQHLEELLSRAWCMDATDMRAEGAIYNINTYGELIERALGPVSSADLRLFETGAGGDSRQTIGVDRIHYARAAEVELYVSPQVASRLRDELNIIEALYMEAAQRGD